MTASPSACRQKAFLPCSGGMRGGRTCIVQQIERVPLHRSTAYYRDNTDSAAPSDFFFYAGVAGKGWPLVYGSERDCAVGELLLLACGDGQCA